MPDTTPLIDPDETLICFGGAVKSLGNGRIGGYLVYFGDANTPDQSIDRQYFTKSTDFWQALKAPIPTLYHHGFDRTLKLRKLSETTVKMDDVGLWAETQLQLRDAYERKIDEMAQEGKLGWSSGSAPHMVRVKKVGSAEEITSWPIVEATLTPTPAEWRAKVVALKSLITTTELRNLGSKVIKPGSHVACKGGSCGEVKSLHDSWIPPLSLHKGDQPACKTGLTAEELAEAGRAAHPSPSDAQKESGNYAKGHVRWKGIPITIECPKGATRSGVGSDGKPWSTTMTAAYGYIKGTKSDADQDHIDVFLFDTDLDSEIVFIVNQLNKDGGFDEHKAILGLPSEEAAEAGYLSNYSDGWTGLGSIHAVTLDQFKWWIANADTSQPIDTETALVSMHDPFHKPTGAVQYHSRKDLTPIMGDTLSTKSGGAPTIKAGDMVKWKQTRACKSGCGMVKSLHVDGKVPGVDNDISGTEDEPVAKVNVYTKATGGKFKATGAHLGHAVKALTVMQESDLEDVEPTEDADGVNEEKGETYPRVESTKCDQPMFKAGDHVKWKGGATKAKGAGCGVVKSIHTTGSAYDSDGGEHEASEDQPIARIDTHDTKCMVTGAVKCMAVKDMALAEGGEGDPISPEETKGATKFRAKALAPIIEQLDAAFVAVKSRLLGDTDDAMTFAALRTLNELFLMYCWRCLSDERTPLDDQVDMVRAAFDEYRDTALRTIRAIQETDLSEDAERAALEPGAIPEEALMAPSAEKFLKSLGGTNAAESAPFAAQSREVVSAVGGFVKRAGDRLQARVKAGRLLSQANHDEIDGVCAALESGVAKLRAILERNAKPSETSPADGDAETNEGGAVKGSLDSIALLNLRAEALKLDLYLSDVTG